jgi:hypothetical protein
MFNILSVNKNNMIIILIVLIVLVCVILFYRLKTIDTLESFTNEDTIDTIKNNNTINNDKIAFLFLTRSNLRCLDIWEAFLKGNENRYTIYCHAKELKAVTDKLLKDNIIPEYVETCWACSNLVEANLMLMKNALLNPQNKKFMLVSESCCPIVSFDTFYKRTMIDDKSHIGLLDNNTPERYIDIVNPEFEEKDFLKHTGSGCIYTRTHTQMLVDALPNLKNWSKQIAPDEHFNGNTLIVMDKNFWNNIEKHCITYDLWQKNKLEDVKLNDDDIQVKSYILFSKISNKVIDILRERDFQFIRKIDEDTEIDKKYILQK